MLLPATCLSPGALIQKAAIRARRSGRTVNEFRVQPLGCFPVSEFRVQPLGCFQSGRYRWLLGAMDQGQVHLVFGAQGREDSEK